MAWGGVAVGGTGSARQHTADAKQESTHAKGSRRRTGASISRTVTADGICNINIGSEFFSSPYSMIMYLNLCLSSVFPLCTWPMPHM